MKNIFILSIVLFSFSLCIAQKPTLVRSELSVNEKDQRLHRVIGLYKNSVVVYYTKGNEDKPEWYIGLFDRSSLKLHEEIKVDISNPSGTYVHFASTFVYKNKVAFAYFVTNEKTYQSELFGRTINLDDKNVGSPVSLMKSLNRSWSTASSSADSSKVLLAETEIHEDRVIVRTVLFDADIKILNSSEFVQNIEKGGRVDNLCSYVYPNGDYVFVYRYDQTPGKDYKNKRINYIVNKVNLVNGQKITVDLGQQNNSIKDPQLKADSEGKVYLTGYYWTEMNYYIGIASADVEKCILKQENISFMAFQEVFKGLDKYYPIDPVDVLPVQGMAGEFYFVSILGGWTSDNVSEQDLSRNINVLRYNCREKKEIWAKAIYRDVLKRFKNNNRGPVIYDVTVFSTGSSVVIFYQNHLNNEVSDVKFKKLKTLRKLNEDGCTVMAKVSPEGEVNKTLLFDNKNSDLDPKFDYSPCFTGKGLYTIALENDQLKLVLIRDIK